MSTLKKMNSMDALSVFNYEGASIAFQTAEGHVMVNATEMAKPFKKLTSNFLKNQEIKDYIQILSQYSNSNTDKIVYVKNGGINQGTWMHELVALRFAQWLSPEFSIWVDRRIKELLIGGTFTSQTITQWHGLTVVLIAGKPHVHYREFLRLTGYSARSGAASSRKRLYPQEFSIHFHQNFVTLEFADQLHQQSARQLSIHFSSN